MEGVGLAQGHVGVHELPDGRAEGAEVALQDPGSALVLGLELGRHVGGGPDWRESDRWREGDERGIEGVDEPERLRMGKKEETNKKGQDHVQLQPQSEMLC